MTTKDRTCRERAATELAAARRKAERLASLPEPASLSIGACVRWLDSRGSRALAIKDDLNRWRHGTSTWSDETLLEHLAFGSGPVEVATSWNDVRVESQPMLEVTQDGYVLTDPTRAISWTRDGDEWVRL